MNKWKLVALTFADRDEALDLLECAMWRIGPTLEIATTGPGIYEAIDAFLDKFRVKEPKGGYRLLNPEGDVVWDSEWPYWATHAR